MLWAAATPSGKPKRTVLMASILSIGLLVCLSAVSRTVVAQEADGEDLPQYWEIHAWLLTIGTSLFVTSYLALWLKFLSRIKGIEIPALATRVSKMWYKLHVYFAATGVAAAVAGAIWGYVMVQRASGGEHLRVTHSYVGLAAALIVLPPLVTGIVSRVMKHGRYTVRWWHLAIGLVSIALMVAGTITGWSIE